MLTSQVINDALLNVHLHSVITEKLETAWISKLWMLNSGVQSTGIRHLFCGTPLYTLEVSLSNISSTLLFNYFSYSSFDDHWSKTPSSESGVCGHGCTLLAKHYSIPLNVSVNIHHTHYYNPKVWEICWYLYLDSLISQQQMLTITEHTVLTFCLQWHWSP